MCIHNHTLPYIIANIRLVYAEPDEPESPLLESPDAVVVVVTVIVVDVDAQIHLYTL